MPTMLGSLILLLATVSADEQVTSIDLREDRDEAGGAIAFYARYESPGSLRGDAFVMLGGGTSPDALEVDRAYGLHLVPGRLRLGPLGTDEVATVRAIERRDDTPPPELFFVRVDAVRVEAVKQILDEWSAKESFDYPIETEFAHMSEQIFKAAGLFPPYRAVFRPFNPIEYYVDLRKLNENLGHRPHE